MTSDAGLSQPQYSPATFATLTGNIGDNTSLARALQSAVFIDMANADYTMSDAEAAAYAKVLSNTGDGTKALTWPSTSDGLYASGQLIYMALANAPITLVSQTGGSTAIIHNGDFSEVAVLPGVGIFCLADAYTSQANMVHTAINPIGDADYTLQASDAGKTIYMGGAGPRNLTINAGITNMLDNAVVYLIQAGAGAVAIGGTATIFGAGGTVSAGQLARIARDSNSDDWYVGR